MSATFVSAATLDEALEAVASGARPVAGGTDLVVGARQGKAPLPESIVAIDRLDGLRAVRDDGDALVLGTLVTHEMLVADPIVRERLHGARRRVRDRRLARDSRPGHDRRQRDERLAGDGHGRALAVLRRDGHRCGRRRGSGRFASTSCGPDRGRHRRAADELLTSLRVPLPPAGTGSSYVRLEYRRQMEIAVVGVAAVATFTGGAAHRRACRDHGPLTRDRPRVATPKLPSPVATAAPGTVGAAAAAAAAEATPIIDVRGSAEYRRAMAEVIARRAIEAAITRGRGGSVPIPASHALFSAVGGASG